MKDRHGGRIMLSLLQNFHFLTVCMIVFLSLSIIFQTIAGVMIHILLQESENMSTARSNALKQCRQKYVNYYKLNGKMINTSVYVDKFVKKLKLLGIPLTRYIQLSGQMMFFFILSTGIRIFLQLSFGKTLFDMVPYYLISILGLYLYFSVMSLTNLEEKKKLLKINLVDYLDNHLCPRLETELSALDELKQKENAGEAASAGKEEPRIVNFSQQQELEALLEEFLY